LFNVFNMRSLKKSVFQVGLFSNKWANIGLLVSFVLMLLVIYTPFFAEIFNFFPISLNEFLLITLISSSVFVFGEIYKFLRYYQFTDKED